MANNQNEPGGSQGSSGPGQYGSGARTDSESREGRPSRQQEEQIELPEHQGVIINYIPPRGGMRSEVGDFETGDEI